MSYVDILALEVDQPTAKFTDEMKFTITFQCKMKPAEDLVWKIVWVGSAKDDPKNPKFDQVLDEVDVPPDVGINKFDFVVDPPDASKIPPGDVLGVTIVMVQAWYKGKEFLRVGYYVSVQYADEKLREEEPELKDGERPDVNILQRCILTAEPRVTRYLIEWDDVMHAAATPEGPSSPAPSLTATAGVTGGGAISTSPPVAGASG